MNLKTRRIIAIIFIIAFLISAPLLILYASGYRYSFKKNQLKKTGALFLETEPKGAQIYIDEELQEQTSPAHLTNIFPNSYIIKVEKENYFNWEKELEIKPQNTTFAEDIILFKKTEPTLINTDQYVYDIHKTKDCLLVTMAESQPFHHDNTFACIDKNDKITNISSQPNITSIKSWSPSKNKFLILNSSLYRILSTDNSYQQSLIVPKRTTQLKWDLKNEHFIYYSANNQIWQINLLGKKPVHSKIYDIGDEQIHDFRAAGDKLYFITSGEDGNFLNLANIQNPEQLIQSIELPSSNFTIDSLLDNSLILINNKRSNIYVLDENLTQTKIKHEGSKKYSYLKDKKLMVIYNDHEIFIYNLNEQVPQSNLIIRYSTKILEVDWFSDNYLIALHDGKIKIIELDNRENHNIWELNTGNLPVRMMQLDDSKENIYFISRDDAGKHSRLWKLNIQ